MRKVKKGILLAFILCLPFVMICHIGKNKKQIEDLQCGKIQMEEGYIPTSDLHPWAAYLWIFPYGIVEVVAVTFYLIYRQD